MLRDALTFGPAGQQAIAALELRIRRRELQMQLGAAVVARDDAARAEIDRALWAVTQQLRALGVEEM